MTFWVVIGSPHEAELHVLSSIGGPRVGGCIRGYIAKVAVRLSDLRELYIAEVRMLLLDRTASWEHRRLLEKRMEVFGKKHLHMLTSMNNLGLVLSDQGKYAEAEAMHRATLALREEVLGKKHLGTLWSLYCLAHSLHQQTQYNEASSLYRKACTDYRETLGPDYSAT